MLWVKFIGLVIFLRFSIGLKIPHSWFFPLIYMNTKANSHFLFMDIFLLNEVCMDNHSFDLVLTSRFYTTKYFMDAGLKIVNFFRMIKRETIDNPTILSLLTTNNNNTTSLPTNSTDIFFEHIFINLYLKINSQNGAKIEILAVYEWIFDENSRTANALRICQMYLIILKLF